MVEAVLQQLLGPGYVVSSAGWEAKEDLPANEWAIAAMKELGYDIGAHRSRNLLNVDLRDVRLIVAVNPNTERRIEALMEQNFEPSWPQILVIGDGGIDAPDSNEEAYKLCAQKIFRIMPDIAAVIKNMK